MYNMPFRKLVLTKKLYRKTCSEYHLDKMKCFHCDRELKVGDTYYRTARRRGCNYKAYCEECYSKMYYDVEDEEDNLEWVQEGDNKWILKEVR